ncbi:MAG: hypothetical protein ACOZFS_15900 [Thermodesulfobacteriota bacterium]
MFNLLFTRPLAALLTLAGVAVLAPVVFPIAGIILKPLVKPVTNLYLDLADEMADAFLERQERKGFIKPEADREELKRLMEEAAENKMRLTEETTAAERLVEGL